jgi:hypothetical protein
MIYFIRAGKHIKIGYCYRLRYVVQRMQQLQIGNHVKLTLVAIIEGDQQTEKDLHKRFKADHVRGEWFKVTYELIECIYSYRHIQIPVYETTFEFRIKQARRLLVKNMSSKLDKKKKIK